MNCPRLQGSDISGNTPRKLVGSNMRACTATRRSRKHRPLYAFTMVEVMVAAVIIVVAIMGLIFGLGVNMQALSASGQSYFALNAARNKIEEMRGRPFNSLVDEYGLGSGEETFPVTWQEGGRTLALPNPWGGNAATIIFELDETNIDEGFGWVSQYDLNGDGDADDVDVSADYKILPVVIRVEWEDATSPRVVETRAILFDPKYP